MLDTEKIPQVNVLQIIPYMNGSLIVGVVTKLINKLNTCENVSILRTDDPTGKTDVSLKSRTDKANKWGADCFFYSQHGNDCIQYVE